MTKRVFTCPDDASDSNSYLCADGSKMLHSGQWVLYDPQGKYVDADTYRTDLAERNDIQLIH